MFHDIVNIITYYDQLLYGVKRLQVDICCDLFWFTSIKLSALFREQVIIANYHS